MLYLVANLPHKIFEAKFQKPHKNLLRHFLLVICTNFDAYITKENNVYIALHSLIGNLINWYTNNNAFESTFTHRALKSSISLFESFNDLRNNHSAAHVNHFLPKAEAEYVVKVISDTLVFLDKIESHIR